MRRAALLVTLVMCLHSPLAGQSRAARPEWRAFEARPDAWYRSEDGLRIAANVVSNQSRRGDWPKNGNTTDAPYRGDPAKISGTFDNDATIHEVRFLARAFGVTHDETCRAAVLRAIDHILEAQYPSGGWPQSFPPGKGYHRYITYNDDTMVNLLELLREVTASDRFNFVDETRRKKAKAAFDAGVVCIIKSQIVVDGKKTAWCAQHDALTLEPRPARTFEPVSLSGSESVGILMLLMSLDGPGPDIVESIESGVRWFQAVKLAGIRQEEINGNKVIVPDPKAPPLWARFYEIGTNRPIFCSRDSVIRYSLAEISAERRNGYGWYSDRPARMLERHEKWTRARASRN